MPEQQVRPPRMVLAERWRALTEVRRFRHCCHFLVDAALLPYAVAHGMPPS